VLLERDLPVFAPLPRQQAAWRDIAVVAGEQVSHEALLQAIAATQSGLVRSARLFDVYKPTQPGPGLAAGERSLAVRIELLDDEATLTDERIDAALGQVLETLRLRLGVRLRA